METLGGRAEELDFEVGSVSWKPLSPGPREQATTRDDGPSPGRTPTKDLSTRARRRLAARIVKRRKRTKGTNERRSDIGGGE
jgi:hypothetical protein